MRTRWTAVSITVLTILALTLAACSDDDTTLSTNSTILTGNTAAPTDSTTTTSDDGAGTTSPGTSLVGQPVGSYEVVARFPNDNGETLHIVIPNGAYTDVDLENFVLDLLESNEDLYGAEIFDDEDAALAFVVEEADRTPEEQELLERHHFVTVVGRDRIEFRGPFSEFPGGAIGS